MRNNGYRNEGSRGRRNRHSTGAGLTGLLILLIGIPVMLPILGVAGIVISAAVGGMGAAFADLMFTLRAVSSGMMPISLTDIPMIGGLAMGVLIGLIAHRMIRARREARAAEESGSRNDVSACGADAQENDYTEPQSCRSFYA